MRILLDRVWRSLACDTALAALALVLTSATAAAETNTVAPLAASGCITPAHTCVTVPVHISRTSPSAMLAFSVTFTLSPELAPCSTPGASILEGDYLSSYNPNTSFLVRDRGNGTYTADGTILGQGNCGPTTASGTLFSIQVTNTGGSGTGSITVTSLTLRDCNNATLPATIGSAGSVTIDLNPVTVASISDPTVAETALLTVTPSATLSSCASGPVSWTATGLPAGAAINAGTGVVTWTPGCTAYESGPSYGPVTVTAHAASGENGSTSFTIHVTNSPGTVAVTVGSSFSVGELSALAMSAPGATLGGCAAGPVSWTVSPPLPAGASLDGGTGVVSWTPACGQAGSYGPFTLTAHAATGESGNGSFSLTVTHKVGTVSVAAISSPQTVAETGTLTITPSATLTSCAAGPLAWSVSPALPSGATFSTSTGVVSWTPGCGTAGSYGPFTLAATAATGEFGSGNAFTIAVTHRAGTVTVAAITDPQTVQEQSLLTITPSATLTACAAGPLTWSVSPALPAGAVFNTGTGVISWTPGCGTAGSFGPFTLTATAATGELGSGNSFAIVVSHKSGSVTVTVGSSFSAQEQSALAMSAPGAALTSCAAGPVSWTVSPALPAGATLDGGTGVVSWTPSCGQAGSYGPFTLTAHAATGESGNGSFSLTVTHKVGTVSVAAIGTQTVAEAALLTVTPSATLTSCAAGPVSWTAVGLPAGAAIDAGTGVVTWTPDCAGFENGPDYGPVTVTAHAATGESGSTSFSIHVTDTPVAIGRVTGLSAPQAVTGNGSSGTTGITVNFTAPSGATSIEVYRASFGNYPEYASTAPTVPGYPPDARWTLTGITASGQVDHPPTRDFWYYVAFAKNACGDVSLASDLTGGTLNYHLGDVTNGATPAVGDNLVNGLDISLLGAHYGISGGAVATYAYLDVGPTTTGLPDGRPLPDDNLDFEDLVIFAINYGGVSGPQARVRPAASSGSDELTLERPGLVAPGALVDVELRLRGSGALVALSTRLSWDPAIVEPVGHAAGDWLAGLGGVAFSPRAGTVDAAMLRPGGMSGEGLLATVTFRVLAAGDPQIRIVTADGRDAHNQTLVVNRVEQPLASSAPSETRLELAAPNPFQTAATLAYSLARAGQVELAVYSVDGRRIRTLVNEYREAGEYRPVWDGRDDRGNRASAGVYYVRLAAAGRHFMRALVYLR